MKDEEKGNSPQIVFIFCLFMIMFCLAFLYVISKTERRDSEEIGGLQSQDTSADNMEDRLIITSSENEDQEQEDKTPPHTESAEKIVLELSCEENEALESNRDEFSLEANDFSITDSVDMICLDQPFDSSVTEKQEWNSSYTGEIYEGDTGYKLYYHGYEDFELYTSNYHFDIKNRTFDEYFIWQITIKTSKYKTAGVLRLEIAWKMWKKYTEWVKKNACRMPTSVNFIIPMAWQSVL